MPAQSPDAEKKPTSEHSFLGRVLEGIRRKIHPGRKSRPGATSETTPVDVQVPMDVQVCDNCHKLYRISKPKSGFEGCFGHPGMFILRIQSQRRATAPQKHALTTSSALCRQAGRPSKCDTGCAVRRTSETEVWHWTEPPMLDLLSRHGMDVFLQVLLPSLLLQPSVQGRSDKGISNSQFSRLLCLRFRMLCGEVHLMACGGT